MAFLSSVGSRHVAPFLCSVSVFLVLPCLMAGASAAQEPAGSAAPPQAAPARSTPVGTLILKNALTVAFRKPDAPVLADSSVAFERVPQAVVNAIRPSGTPVDSPLSEADTEKGLDAFLRSLPPGSLWVKIYLPSPPTGRSWKADDVSALVYAQARLFGKIGAPSADGSIEVLGKRIDKETAASYISGLGLKPVYLITNPKRQMSVSAWSAASESQWSAMSRDERKQYGQDQAAAILALPPEERGKVLDRIRQHDKFFDTVKDPLEKLLGHDL